MALPLQSVLAPARHGIVILILVDTDDRLLASSSLHASPQTFCHRERRECLGKSFFLADNGFGPKSGLCPTVLNFVCKTHTHTHTHTNVGIVGKKYTFITMILSAATSSLKCRCEAPILSTGEASFQAPTISPRKTPEFFTLLLLHEMCMSKVN